MEIKKVKNGWEYKGIIFVKKSDAIVCKEETEKKGNVLPKHLSGKRKLEVVYDSTDPRSFGKFVADFLMKSKGKKTIVGLSKEIGVSKQTLFNWINGDSVPSATHTEKIMAAFDCNAKDVLKALETNYRK